MRILVVEDTQDVGEAIVACLERLGHAVDWQKTGPEAEDALKVQRYDLVVLDVMLPCKDGFAVLNGMRAEKITSPVLVLTARSQIDDRVTALDHGADDYLVKPFDFREFEARVRACSGARAVRPRRSCNWAMSFLIRCRAAPLSGANGPN